MIDQRGATLRDADTGTRDPAVRRNRNVPVEHGPLKLFACQTCGATLFFENTSCGRCGARLGYLPDLASLSVIEDDATADGVVLARADPTRTFRRCDNARWDVCSWLVNARSGERFCAACRHNRLIPNLADPAAVERWRKLEGAKHRMIYSLIRLGISLPNRIDNPTNGLAFDFLEDWPGQRVMTGHGSGIVTIAAQEADDAVREDLRHRMHESYRTLLGHFRHEVGHWIWDRLVRDGGRLERCRALFGDDREDYGAALRRHYSSGAPADWQLRHITAYASTHPWEDFAETWAHYLHIMDTLETASAFGVNVAPGAEHRDMPELDGRLDPYGCDDFAPILAAWMPLVFAVNAVNRSMGIADLYPFVISPSVTDKLGFVHEIARSAR